MGSAFFLPAHGYALLRATGGNMTEKWHLRLYSLAVPYFRHYLDTVRPQFGTRVERGHSASEPPQNLLFKDLELCARSLFSLLLRPLP